MPEVDDALWDAWDARLRTKAWLLVVHLGLLAGVAGFFALMSAVACGSALFVAGILADGGGWGGVAFALPALMFPVCCAAMVLGALALVVADYRSARGPARVLVGRVTDARFEPGMRFGRMRWELDLVPQSAWRATRDRSLVPLGAAPPETVRTLPWVGRRSDLAVLLVLGDGVCCHQSGGVAPVDGS